MILTMLSGCIFSGSNYPKKSEKFWLVFKKDTVNISFLIDSSFNKIEDAIQWGYLKRVCYKNDDTELCFNFFEDQTVAFSRLPDSLVVNNAKNRYKILVPGAQIKTMNKISNDKLYGIVEQIDHPGGIFYVFTGEFVTIHLSFLIEINCLNKGRDEPEILNDFLDSLRIDITTQ